MVSDGLIEVQNTTVLKHARRAPTPEPKLAHKRKEGRAKLLRVFVGEAGRWHDESLYGTIVKTLRMVDIAGATVYRGILGFGAKEHQYKKTFFHASRDMAILVTVIEQRRKKSRPLRRRLRAWWKTALLPFPTPTSCG